MRTRVFDVAFFDLNLYGELTVLELIKAASTIGLYSIVISGEDRDKILETTLGKWKIKVFAPPKEHGPAHVHVIAKGEKAEVKISLVTLEVIGSTQFSVRAVKGIIKYIHENYEYLWKCWEALHGKNEKTKSKASFKKSR